MRTREEIYQDERSHKGSGWGFSVLLIMEVLLDIRDELHILTSKKPRAKKNV